MIKHLGTIGLVVFMSNVLVAQQDTIHLKPALVSELRINQHGIGSKVEVLDSAKLQFKVNQDLSSVLSELSPVYIKSYGPGNLATTSFRGGSASHTVLVWNGFTINSPSNGLVDLSLIPVNLHDKISIQYGPSTTLWGSGAIGGAILLDSKPHFSSGWKANYSIVTSVFDSFNNINGYSNAAGVSYGNTRHFTSLKLWNRKNNNEYEYPASFKNESSYSINRNAEVKNQGGTVDWFWRLSPRQSIDAHYWYQFVDRDVAPTIFEANNHSNLKESTHRFGIHYSLGLKNSLLNIRTAGFHLDMLFANDDLEDSPSKSQTIISEIEWSKSIDKKYFISFGFNQNFNRSGSKNYVEILPLSGGQLVFKSQNRWAAFGAFKTNLLRNQLAASLSIRQEWVDGQKIPFIFNVGFDYRLIKALSLKVNWARLYRTPNINDLYWNPGGNPDLLPEKGYSAEFTLSVNLPLAKDWNFAFNYTNYYKRVQNWIQWAPGIIWTPQNLLEVESYGLETDLLIGYTSGNWKYTFSGRYAYTLAHNIKEGNTLSDNIGKQLIYTPIYTVGFRFNVDYKAFQIGYNQQYTGFTFISTDHEEYLSPYRPANIRFAYRKKIKLHQLALWFSVNNLYNEGYAIVAARPMPLRNYTLGLSINLNQKQSK